ncbi:hypothetical protein RRG08_049986 [Elysia crispata]|uniref:Uncharacterized protein n=1 Tax=Elysia crispata TaxID=231223 RepID=A0AAE1EC54_9GAST|nr:hypothetical protein RRG08_049986 [Elysia crispata]
MGGPQVEPLNKRVRYDLILWDIPGLCVQVGQSQQDSGQWPCYQAKDWKGTSGVLVITTAQCPLEDTALVRRFTEVVLSYYETIGLLVRSNVARVPQFIISPKHHEVLRSRSATAHHKSPVQPTVSAKASFSRPLRNQIKGKEAPMLLLSHGFNNFFQPQVQVGGRGVLLYGDLSDLRAPQRESVKTHGSGFILESKLG